MIVRKRSQARRMPFARYMVLIRDGNRDRPVMVTVGSLKPLPNDLADQAQTLAQKAWQKKRHVVTIGSLKAIVRKLPRAEQLRLRWMKDVRGNA